MPKSSKRKQARVPSAPSGEAVTVKETAQTDVTTPAPKPAYKAKTPEERKQAHIEGIIKTAVASVIGVIAGILSYSQFGIAGEVRWYAVIIIVVALAYYALRLLFPLIRINTKEFGFKDWFYVEFLVVDFCLVTWTLLLN